MVSLQCNRKALANFYTVNISAESLALSIHFYILASVGKFDRNALTPNDVLRGILSQKDLGLLSTLSVASNDHEISKYYARLFFLNFAIKLTLLVIRT
jgi:hypothetical protein